MAQQASISNGRNIVIVIVIFIFVNEVEVGDDQQLDVMQCLHVTIFGNQRDRCKVPHSNVCSQFISYKHVTKLRKIWFYLVLHVFFRLVPSSTVRQIQTVPLSHCFGSSGSP